jgi:hypothetical protein
LVTDVVGQDDEVLCWIEQASGKEDNAGKTRGEKLYTRATGAVQDKDSVVDMTAATAMRLAQNSIMQSQLGQDRSVAELESLSNVVAFARRWPVLHGLRNSQSAKSEGEDYENEDQTHRRQIAKMVAAAALSCPRSKYKRTNHCSIRE